MLEEPDFAIPMTDGLSYVCIEDNRYVACLNEIAARVFLYDLFWFATKAPVSEEISISSDDWNKPPCKGKRIGYCEFNLVAAHRHKKQGKTILKTAETVRHKPHGIYTEVHDRLDYFVSRDEVVRAYETVKAWLEAGRGRKSIREITLFDTLTIRLVSTNAL